MSDPVDRMIDDAAGALRAATSGPSPDAQRTRARVLSTHRARSARTSQVTTWIAMAAAVLLLLGGSTAWAYWTGRLDRFFAPAPSAPSAPEAPPAPAPPSRAATAPVAPPIEVAPEVVPVPEVAPVVEAAVPPTAVEGVAAERDETPPESDEEPVDPAERRAYREAHRLHFDAHDAAGAIVAWDQYLRAYPRGRFALEARYNRALCLVRVGRHEEARAALEPFVRGTHGGYRQREATALLEALGEE